MISVQEHWLLYLSSRTSVRAICLPDCPGHAAVHSAQVWCCCCCWWWWWWQKEKSCWAIGLPPEQHDDIDDNNIEYISTVNTQLPISVHL